MSRPHWERNLRGLISLALLGIILAGHAQSYPQAPEPNFSEDPPVWKVDLRKYGYKPPRPDREGNWSLTFSDNDTVVVAWTALDEPGTLNKKVDVTTAPKHMHALALNALTGEKKSERDWPTSILYATLIPAGIAGFLTCTGSAFQLLSSDFDVIREQPLARPGNCNFMGSSPSGRTASINTSEGEDHRRTLVDTGSFRALASWSDEATNVRFTDAILVGNCKPDLVVCIRKFDQPWAPLDLSRLDEQMRKLKGGIPFLVNDSTLLLVTHLEMAVVTMEGTLCFEVNLPNKALVRGIARSVSGDRFVVLLSKMRGLRAEGLDMYPFPSDDHLAVYSLEEKKAIYARKVEGTSPWLPWVTHRNQIALSPDGHLVADLVLNDGILAVYRLPRKAS